VTSCSVEAGCCFGMDGAAQIDLHRLGFGRCAVGDRLAFSLSSRTRSLRFQSGFFIISFGWVPVWKLCSDVTKNPV